MNTFKVLTLVFILALGLSSCGKDDTAPVINITAPTEGAILMRGTTYQVVGTVTDDEELAKINAGGVLITTFDSPTKHTLANLNLTFGPTDTLVNYKINITAEDKEGNVATKDVNFKVQ